MKQNCPSCRHIMERANRGSVQFWRCACGGYFIAISSVRRMLPEGMWKNVWPTLREAASPGAHGCPGCGNRMDVTTALAQFGGQSIDVCDRCQMLWLDPTELESMPKRDVAAEIPLEQRQAVGRAMATAMNFEYDEREASIGAPFETLARTVIAFAGVFGGIGPAGLED
jgi:Zn-finger nucleic acid-binding protein